MIANVQLDKSHLKLTCPTCNKEFEVIRSQAGYRIYCSAACKQKAPKKTYVFDKVCIHCGKMFTSKDAYSVSCKKCSGETTQSKTKNVVLDRQTVVNACDCIPSGDITQLRKMHNDKLLDIDMILRKLLKLKILLEEKGR